MYNAIKRILVARLWSQRRNSDGQAKESLYPDKSAVGDGVESNTQKDAPQAKLPWPVHPQKKDQLIFPLRCGLPGKHLLSRPKEACEVELRCRIRWLWLGEEIMYCLACPEFEFDFICEYASPALIAELRKLSRDDQSEAGSSTF
jgi:hypothetical protein